MKKDRFRKIESLNDIESEKQRLKLQIELAEEKINYNFRSLTERLTLSSISSNIKESALGTVYKVFGFGYNLFTGRKKKA